MTAQSVFTLINPQTKALGLRIYTFDDDAFFQHTNNESFYSMLLVYKGKGRLKADVSEYDFSGNSLICLSIYQPFSIQSEGEFSGVLINFHPDFFCIHKHQQEVSCNGVLFNNIYDSPVVPLTKGEMSALQTIADQLKTEVQQAALAQYELLVSYLKIFLISGSRSKVACQDIREFKSEKEPFLFKTLKDAIEEHYKTKHSPSEYAEILNMTTKSVNRMSKVHFNKTLSNLIAERIVIEAKRELYLTEKPIKKIAFELGFNDEFYFSRFFKSNAKVAPQIYRNTVGFNRASA
jgi:AraC family transcriptional activator of pobA